MRCLHLYCLPDEQKAVCIENDRISQVRYRAPIAKIANGWVLESF